MLEASDIEKVNNVSPFLGTIIDTFCGKEGTGCITRVFKLYFGILSVLKQKHGELCCSKQEVQTQQTRILMSETRKALISSICKIIAFLNDYDWVTICYPRVVPRSRICSTMWCKVWKRCCNVASSRRNVWKFSTQPQNLICEFVIMEVNRAWRGHRKTQYVANTESRSWTFEHY